MILMALVIISLTALAEENGNSSLNERLYKAKRKDGTPEDKVKEDLKQIAPYHIYQYIIDELHD